MNNQRRPCREISAGSLKIGGSSPVSIQSMTTADTQDAEAVIEEIKRLKTAGADMVRFAVPDIGAAKSVGRIKKEAGLPIVADIHFDYRLALLCIDAGIDKIRINPGNIGAPERVKEVARAAKSAGVPIRIGVNSGSIEKNILAKYGATAQAMVESAKYHASLLEKEGMDDIVISLKASEVRKTVEAYRLMARQCDYPLHLGITEAGTPYHGIIKSSAGIGALLLDGIGDTVRVSLTADPVQEVKAARSLLCALGLRKGAQMISCPTCARCKINLFELAEKVERHLETVEKSVCVAVMGCAVNGPGEAAGADIGIAGGDGCALLFKKGEIIRKIKEEEILKVLFSEIDMFGEGI